MTLRRNKEISFFYAKRDCCTSALFSSLSQQIVFKEKEKRFWSNSPIKYASCLNVNIYSLEIFEVELTYKVAIVVALMKGKERQDQDRSRNEHGSDQIIGNEKPTK